VKDRIRSELVDEMMEMYVAWREACIALRKAYEQWSTVRVAERELAFATYQAALDWEEQASRVYADRVSGVGRALADARQSAPRSLETIA
jgi:hypothetical protein